MFSDAHSKANAFNSFFHSTFSQSDFQLPSFDKLPTPSDQLHEIEIDPEEVYKSLSTLDITKAMGSDDLYPSLLQIILVLYEYLNQ